MIKRVVKHIQGNAIAYVALFFAVGGGGGYAVAATTAATTTVHACVSKKNHAVYIDKKCGKTTTALLLDQRGPAGTTGKTGATGATGATGPAGPQGPAGTNAVVAYAEVTASGQSDFATGLTVTQTSTGNYTVTVTAPACASSGVQIPVVSAVGAPSSGLPEIVTGPGTTNGTFTVSAGDQVNGTYTAGGQAFDVQDACAS